MAQVIGLLRAERRARYFFAALAQSAIGTWAGYVALLLIAVDRFDSPWAIGLILLADVLPAMLLGPIFGALADRLSRRTCMVVADVLRALAFTGIVLVHSFEATIVLALVAGVGSALFIPSSLAGLRSLVAEHRLPAATALYGAATDLGFIAGPAVAAGILLFGSPESILVGNAITFALSALVLVRLQFGAAPTVPNPSQKLRVGLFREVREGFAELRLMPSVSWVLLASGAALFFVGLFNVAELLLVRDHLGGADAAFSLLVTVFGIGFIGGSLTGSRGGDLSTLTRRFVFGLLLMGFSMGASGAVPSVVAAIVPFAAAGYGNGLLLVHERLVIQAVVPDQLTGRVFGLKDTLASWAFGTAFIGGSTVLSLVGTRAAVILAGAGILLVGLLSAVILLRAPEHELRAT